MDGETESLTLNQINNLETIIDILENEIMSHKYDSDKEAELKEALVKIYYVLGR